MNSHNDLSNTQINIYGYCRISVDDNLDDRNISIENQKDIIQDYVLRYFPDAKLTFFEDRDKSGYTFDQRTGYQAMRKRLMNGDSKILIIKDFSRFSRRNSKGLCELEDLRDAGVRIISIGDAIDYPTHDEWLQIQFRFLINEMPVTDTSKKVRKVISRRQEKGEWITIVPYGYEITNMRTHEIAIDEEAAINIRKIYDLYINGWGYKRIANYLTEQGIPTPRMYLKNKIIESGGECRWKESPIWSIVTVQEILTNDFYNGTLRQGKYRRTKINGSNEKVAKEDHIVFENHHEAIIDNKTWMMTQDLLKRRTTGHYRGQKKYDNDYTGLMFCGDCGCPMFSMSRGDIAPAYICGTYHKRGLKGCTSHHVRVDFLDSILKDYLIKVKENSSDMLDELEKTIGNDSIELDENANTLAILNRNLTSSREELKAIQRRKNKDLLALEIQYEQNASPNIKHKMELIEDSYCELEDDITLKIFGLQEQIANYANKRSQIIQAQRLSRTVLDVFDAIINKPKLDKLDIQLIVDRIDVYSDHIDIKLKADIDALLQRNPDDSCEELVNFQLGSKVIEKEGMLTYPAALVRVKIVKQREQLFTVNVVNNGSLSLICKVLRISFGITMRPKSSIRLTMPVAFI